MIIFEGYVYRSMQLYEDGTPQEDWYYACIRGSGTNPGIYTTEAKAWSSNKPYGWDNNKNFWYVYHSDGSIEKRRRSDDKFIGRRKAEVLKVKVAADVQS